jgi:tagatose 1,6-diphosphate aldolase
MPHAARITTPGKARGLARISDGEGRYAVLAIDQRWQLFEFIGRALGRPADAVESETGEVKAVLASALASQVTGLLVDPFIGYHRVVPDLPRQIGLLLTLEDHEFETGPDGHRASRLMPGWTVSSAVRAGAEALKLLVWYRDDAPQAVRRRQVAFVRGVGEQCRQADRPFVLEILPYRLPGEPDEEYARRLPDLTMGGAETFADPALGVDLYKLALPGSPDGVREWRGALYGLAELRGVMTRLTGLLPAPWVLLSGGMPAARFIDALGAALDAGARGYLAGRAVWWEPLQAYPDLVAIRRNLETTGLATLAALNRALERLPPQRPPAAWRLRA